MNVFEDLVVELKEENLLENTVIEELTLNVNFGEPQFGNEASFLRRAESVVTHSSVSDSSVSEGKLSLVPEIGFPIRQEHCTELAAVYQVVEHILTAVERQATGSTKAGFDDLRVSKSLHRLSQASADPASEEFAETQKEVAGEITVWVKGLAKRDSVVTVSQLRQYCDNCQPALSSQALFSLARFYYELPTNDTVRAKFDFVLTKLFTKPADGGLRQLIFPKTEIVGHLNSRFGTWNRRNSTSPNDADGLLNSVSCDDFIAEVKRASTLSELNGSDFFTRIRVFKESAGNNFFSPSVAASVIECNVTVGNKLVTLLQAESKRIGEEQLKEKYSFLERDSFESTANRTFDLEEVLKAAALKREARPRKPVISQKAIDKELVDHKVEPTAVPEPERIANSSWISSSLAVNKWLLIAGSIAIVISVGLYFWAERIGSDVPSSTDVKKVEMESLPFKEFVKDGRISSDTFYGMTTAGWDQLNKDQKSEVVAKILRSGGSLHYKRVSLINSQGKTVGMGAGDHIEVGQQ